MKNLFIFLRFALTVFVICVIYDLISNKKFAVDGMQMLTSVIISILVGAVFTIIFFSKTYTVSRQSIDLDVLEKKLEKKNFRLVEESDKCLCFRGNWSYTFYVGDIDVDIMDKEVRLSGTKYVLSKVLG